MATVFNDSAAVILQSCKARSADRMALVGVFVGIDLSTVCLLDLQEHDGLIERWKRKAMDNILELHNKTPVWNDG